MALVFINNKVDNFEISVIKLIIKTNKMSLCGFKNIKILDNIQKVKGLSLIRVMSNFDFLDHGWSSTLKIIHFLLLQKLAMGLFSSLLPCNWC